MERDINAVNGLGQEGPVYGIVFSNHRQSCYFLRLFAPVEVHLDECACARNKKPESRESSDQLGRLHVSTAVGLSPVGRWMERVEELRCK